MPRVKMRSDEAKVARLSEMIQGRKKYLGWTDKQVGEVIDRCAKTAAEMLDDPTKMTVGQLLSLGRAMNISITFEPMY